MSTIIELMTIGSADSRGRNTIRASNRRFLDGYHGTWSQLVWGLGSTWKVAWSMP